MLTAQVTRDTLSYTNPGIFDGGFGDCDNHDDESYWDSDEEDIVANKTCDDYYNWDTDDEVEEANIGDDIIKMIEGTILGTEQRIVAVTDKKAHGVNK